MSVKFIAALCHLSSIVLKNNEWSLTLGVILLISTPAWNIKPAFKIENMTNINDRKTQKMTKKNYFYSKRNIIFVPKYSETYTISKIVVWL